MRIVMSGKNVQIPDALKARAEKKVGKLERYFNPDIEAQIRFSLEKGNRNICEITIPFYGDVLRAEETSGDLYMSLDRALEKIERQIHKHRTKLEKKMRDTAFQPEMPEYASGYDFNDADDRRIVRTKRFSVKPMSVEDAIFQMDLVSHNFYVFTNAETGLVSVLYLRNDGGYGLIEPET